MYGSIIIEYVCKGNGMRSPIAQTVARAYVKEKGLEDRVKVYSSGTVADRARNDIFSFPVEALFDLLKTGVKNHVFHPPELYRQLRDLVENRKTSISKIDRQSQYHRDLVKQAFKYALVDEETKRNRVLLEAGLVPWGPFRQQTVRRDDVTVIVAMDEEILEQVKEIYCYTDMPKIELISEGGIYDAFPGTLDHARMARDDLMKIVPITVDRAV